MVHRIQNRNPGYSDFATNSASKSFGFSAGNQNLVSEGANALKLENEVIINNNQQENMNESVDEVNNQYHEELLKNQNLESIIEDTSDENEVSFSQEALDNNLKDASANLKEFGVESDEPDLFSSDNQATPSDDLLNSNTDDQEEDDLEIPAFLRRQKN